MGKRRTQSESFSDQLRRLISESDMSRNQICIATKIDPSHLHRFVHGTGRLTNDTIDRLVDALELCVVGKERVGD
jgi:predicted transcriptional regulator